VASARYQLREGFERPVNLPTTLGEMLRAHALGSPNSPAILEPGWDAMTYAGLADQQEATEKFLIALGIGRNDRVATVLPAGATTAVCNLTLSACASAVPLNPQYTGEEFEGYLQLLAPAALIVRAGDATAARSAAARQGIRIIELVPTDGRGAGGFELHGERSRRPGPLAPATAEDVALVMLTSGSTSRPKLVPLHHKTVIYRAWTNAQWVGLEADDRGLLFMPLFHGQGFLAGLCPPVLVGGSVIVLSEFDPAGFFHLLEEYEATWFTAGPTHLRAILDLAPEHRAAVRHRPVRFVRTGSGQLSAGELAMLQEEFAAPVIETYNCSEAGQLAGGLLSWAEKEKESGVSPMAASSDAAVMDEGGHLLGCGETGEIVARGDGVIPHYLDNPELTADSFRNGWFHTGDLGSIDRDGFLRIKGRIKEIIDYGGESISPGEIEGVLSAHPEVETAVSFAIPHPSLGQQVAAAVVLGAGARATEGDLKRYLRARLAHFKVPRKIILMDAIPVGPTGKVLRDKLVTQIKDADRHADGDQTPKLGPRTPLERTLIDLWCRQLKRQDIGVDDDFFLLGGDSLQAIDLFLGIENKLGKVLPRSILLEASTIGELARAIENERPSDTLISINPAGSLPPLYCVHDGSGQVLLFRHLSRHLGGEQPLYGLQAHGIDGKAPFRMSVERMAADYVESIRRHQSKGPYYLAGYSFGGQVAFEMAHQLLSVGEHVALLVLLDSHLFGPGTRVSTGKWLRRHIKRFARLNRGERFTYLKTRVVNAAEIATAVVRKPIIDRALERGARGRSMSPDRFWDIAAYASRRYRPPVIDCRTVLLRTQLYAWSHPSVHTGWNDLVEHGVEMIRVPGSHSEFLEEPYVRQVAAELHDQLRRAREAYSGGEED